MHSRSTQSRQRSLDDPGMRVLSSISRASSALDQFQEMPVSVAVTDGRCRELGGKLIGQPTRVMRDHFKVDDEPIDVEWEGSMAKGGSGLRRVLRGAKRAFYAPVRWYLDAVYSCRPSLTSKEARAEQWGALHSPDRYILAMLVGFGPPGYFFYNTRWPLALITVLILFNCTYETLGSIFPSIPDFANNSIWDIFRQGTFAISVVLGFKVNQVYQRFWLARQAYGGLCGNLNSLAQLMHLYAHAERGMSSLTVEEKLAYLDEINRYCVCYSYALIMQLLTLDHLPNEARHLISQAEIDLLESTKKPRKFVHFRLQELILRFNLKTEHYLSVQQLLSGAEMNAGTCRRIKFTPLPFGVSLVTTGFVMLWLVLLPFGLTTSEKDSTATMIVSTWIAGLALFILSAMLLAIDEAANQLEDPFHSLPLFDATKTAMAHLSIVAQDFAKMKTATASTSVE